MDEDEAFLYGDEEVITEPKNLKQSSSEAPPPVFKSTFEPVSRISATPELSDKPLAVETTSISPLPTSIADIKPDVSTPCLNPAKSTEDISSDIEPNEEPELNPEPDEDDDQDAEEEDSDDDLHIILEGDGTHLHSAPNARASVSTSRPEILRESPAQPRAIDPENATTEYKILERIEGKPADPSTPGPAKPASSLSHNQHRNPYELPIHNRLPTPDNFPRPATPPHDSSLEDQQPPINSEAPVPLTGYDDKDGTTLMNFDFDAIPESEKGWKKPGAHVADWFNYGFDETTWRWYVMKQKRHRADESWAANPFAAFATGNIQEAWDTLPSELKGIMMQTIMGPNGGTNGNHGPPMPPPPMPQMMVMNPMMQGMDMGGFGMQGMQGMPGMMGNGHMNGTHPNAGMNNQHNEGPSRGVKQDPAGVSEADGETPGHYADGMDPREQQHHHEQQRMQDQMRHMQHMQHMGMGPGFMPGMDLAAMFGNQEMYMNPGQFNGMMEMPQMPQMQHMNSQMQQQMGGGSGMNMGMSPGISSGVTAGPMNAGIVPNLSQPPTITSPAVPTSALATASAPLSVSSAPASAPGPPPGSTPGPVPGPAATPAGLVSTPVGSPGSSMNIQSPLTAGRGRGRGGRGRGNPPASAFLAAAAARGRGRVLSSNGPGAGPPSTVPPVTTPIVTPPLINSVPDTVPTSNAVPVAEQSPERSTRAISPLPSNVPTGPRKAALPNPAPARPIRVTPVGYFDKDAAGARGDDGLDYGGGSAESPHEERKMSLLISRRQGHRNDREKLEEDPRERPENYSERSRSKSRDKELDEKDSSSGLHRKSRHHHRGRSRSKESDHRSSREKSEKDKEESLNHKSSRGSGGSRRNRKSKRTTETDEKDDPRDGPSDERDRDRDKEKGRERGRDKDKERDRDREKEKEREKQKERDRDKNKDGDKDKGKDEMKDKEYDKDKERERDDGIDAGAEHGTSGSSRKRKSTKEDRGSRSSKRERAE